MELVEQREDNGQELLCYTLFIFCMLIAVGTIAFLELMKLKQHGD